MIALNDSKTVNFKSKTRNTDFENGEDPNIPHFYAVKGTMNQQQRILHFTWWLWPYKARFLTKNYNNWTLQIVKYDIMSRWGAVKHLTNKINILIITNKFIYRAVNWKKQNKFAICTMIHNTPCFRHKILHTLCFFFFIYPGCRCPKKNWKTMV